MIHQITWNINLQPLYKQHDNLQSILQCQKNLAHKYIFQLSTLNPYETQLNLFIYTDHHFFHKWHSSTLTWRQVAG